MESQFPTAVDQSCRRVSLGVIVKGDVCRPSPGARNKRVWQHLAGVAAALGSVLGAGDLRKLHSHHTAACHRSLPAAANGGCARKQWCWS